MGREGRGERGEDMGNSGEEGDKELSVHSHINLATCTAFSHGPTPSGTQPSYANHY